MELYNKKQFFDKIKEKLPLILVSLSYIITYFIAKDLYGKYREYIYNRSGSVDSLEYQSIKNIINIPTTKLKLLYYISEIIFFISFIHIIKTIKSLWKKFSFSQVGKIVFILVFIILFLCFGSGLEEKDIGLRGFILLIFLNLLPDRSKLILYIKLCIQIVGFIVIANYRLIEFPVLATKIGLLFVILSIVIYYFYFKKNNKEKIRMIYDINNLTFFLNLLLYYFYLSIMYGSDYYMIFHTKPFSNN
ncbi:hypothetical protein [Fusobacterium sp. PH5-44]|uniref:hypothetical protein n=1 Tax=unclassified Fusobacterium TaxID=2648384 RepID=UPI003D195166